jgi:FkbM family methyltransferase
LLHRLGFDLIRYQKHLDSSNKKSIYSKRLTFYKTESGNYYLPSDAELDVIANAIKNNEIFDKEIVDVASKYIKPNTVVLDVGANFGQMSVIFSNMVGEKGVVHSFEADDWVFEILCKNIEANNKQGKIIPHFGAVHNVDGKILYFPVQDFKRFGTYGSYGIDYNAQNGRKVNSLTIDSLNIEQPISFMKIDIQGGDLLAMQGAVKTIEKNKMPIIFEYEYLFEDDFNLCFQDYVDFVQSIGYKFEKVINGQNYLIIPK